MSSHTAEARFQRHLKESRRPGSTAPLHHAIRKYGADNVRIVVLAESTDKSVLAELEVQFIAEQGTMSPAGYNCTAGGEGVVGLSEESEAKRRRSISASLTGKILTQEHKAALSRSHQGKPSARRGVVVTPEVRQKMSEAAKKRWENPEQREMLTEHLRELSNSEQNKLHCRKLGEAWKGKKRK